MAISPIGNIEAFTQSPNSIFKTSKSEEFIPFKDILTDAINNVNTTQRTNEQDLKKLATGQADDLHTLMINSAKADLALQTLVQVRNKAIDAYNEIMRINL